MGNREALLAGAKRCLYEKGYARTTARDIATAAGTSLAAIGYHFRSTEALLNAALLEATEEWGDAIGASVLAQVDAEPGSFEHFEAVWTAMIESFEKTRGLLSANFEVFPHLDQAPELRRSIAGGLQDAREGWAKIFQKIDPKADPDKARAVGGVYQALSTGIIAQWLVDPERAPSGRDLADGLRVIVESTQRTAGPG